MSMTSDAGATTQRDAIAAIMEDSDAIPEEYRVLMGGVLQSADDNMLGSLMADAMRAKMLVDSGQKEEARVIIEQYRTLAEDAGLGGAFDQLLGGILD